MVTYSRTKSIQIQQKLALVITKIPYKFCPDFLQTPFKNDSIIDWVQGDLNEDGVPDFLVVLQSIEEYPEITGMDETFVRTLLILETDGKFPDLLVSRVNGSIIDCSTCGGAGVGDPFYGVYIDSTWIFN